jgi:hypothetical protein
LFVLEGLKKVTYLDMRRNWYIVLGLWFVCMTQNAQAQFSVDFRQKPLEQALQQIVRQTGINLVYRPELVSGKRTSCTLSNANADALLACTLQNTRLEVERLPSGTYILKAQINTPAIPVAPLRGALSGRVLDVETQRPLRQATVKIMSLDVGTWTNVEGAFSLTNLEAGQYRVTVSYLGYRPMVQEVAFDPSRPATVTFRLMQRPVEVLPVEVEGLQNPAEQQASGISQVTPEELLTSRGVGTPDVLQSLGTLAGVHINDALGELHIQGGDSGEHQMVLDGMPIFEPIHLRGLVSAFSPFALSQVSVHKAGFGADKGSFLSGVVELQHNLDVSEAGKQILGVQMDAQSLNARWAMQSSESPTHYDRSFSAMVAGRLGLGSVYQPQYIQNLLKDWGQPDRFLPFATLLPFTVNNTLVRLVAEAQKGVDPKAFDHTNAGFNDLHAAALWKWDKTKSLYTSIYGGFNQVSGNELVQGDSETPANRDEYQWGNIASQVKYQQLLSIQWIFQTQIRYSHYQLSHQYNVFGSNDLQQRTFTLPDGRAIVFTSDQKPADDGNRIDEIGWSGHLEKITSKHDFQVGIEASHLNSHFAFTQVTTRLIDFQQQVGQLAGFVQDLWHIRPYLEVETGLRLTRANDRKIYAEPRLAFQGKREFGRESIWSWRLATGLYRQFLNRFDLSSFSPSAMLPYLRFWMPTDAIVKPPRAIHFSAESVWALTPSSLIRVEGYYKRQKQLVSLDYAALWQLLRTEKTATAQSQFVTSGEGFSYGGLVSMQRDWKHIRLLARYEYSHAERREATRFEGKWLPTAWNEPHRLQVSLYAKLNDYLRFSVRSRDIWGRAWGFRKAYYDYLTSDPQNIPIYGDFNLNEPDLHQLSPLQQIDVGFSWDRKFARSNRQAMNLQFRGDFLNVLNRKNVAEWWFVLPDINQTNYERIDRNLLPFIPAVSLRLGW